MTPPIPPAPTRSQCLNCGYSLVELLIASAIGAILSLAAASFFKHATLNAMASSKKINASTEIRSISEILRLDFFRMVDVFDASPASCTFVQDSSVFLSPTGNVDGDGLVNRIDPDVDGDQRVVPTSAAEAWRVGNNLDDDDDDNDGKVDVVCRYRLDGTTIKRSVSINTPSTATLSGQESIVARRVSRFVISYEGSNLYPSGRAVDTAPMDGIVTPEEIDSGFEGNADGIPFNTRSERGAIGLLRVEVGIDIDGDGMEDGKTDFTVSPPLLPLKRKY